MAVFAGADGSLAKQQPQDADEPRLRVEGNRLIYHGFVEQADGDDRIKETYTAQFRALLEAHPEFREEVLRSNGGMLSDAIDIAVIFADQGLDKSVDGYCASACPLIFIASEHHLLGSGGRLGFHNSSWSLGNMKEFYKNSCESFGWMDEFAFAACAYREGICDLNKKLAFFAAQDVDTNFIVPAAFVQRYDMWYPTRDEFSTMGSSSPACERRAGLPSMIDARDIILFGWIVAAKLILIIGMKLWKGFSPANRVTANQQAWCEATS